MKDIKNQFNNYERNKNYVYSLMRLPDVHTNRKRHINNPNWQKISIPL